MSRSNELPLEIVIKEISKQRCLSDASEPCKLVAVARGENEPA